MKRISTAARLAASLTLLGFVLQVQATPTLYVADGSRSPTENLYIMDPTTGLITQTIGPIGFRLTGMAFDPTTGILYGSTKNNSISADSIILIDPITGAGMLIGSTGAGTMTDLAFDANGTLYGWSDRRSTGFPNRSDLPDMVELLLSRGAQMNLPDDEPWATPLAWAIRRGNRRIAHTLRDTGATA